MEVWKFGLFVTLLQVGRCLCEETERCQPGFSSESHVFKVTRKVLERGRVLGKVSFDDCSGRRLRSYYTEDNRFRVFPDGTVSVKRQLDLHGGIKTFEVHTWDATGNKVSTQVVLCNEKEHSCTQDSSHDAQHELPESLATLSRKKRAWSSPPIAIAENQRETLAETINERPSPDGDTEDALGRFPRYQRDLHRQKRDWIIPPIILTENDRGPFPKALVQVKTNKKHVSYSITGPGANMPPVGVFTMDSRTGWMLVTRPVDREDVATYTIFCHAVDASTEKLLEDPMELIIRVTDQNDHRPVFTEATFQGRVQEGSQPGTPVMHVTAIDADDSEDSFNGVVAYRILNQEPKLPFENMFTINRETGLISVASTGLEYQKVPKYTLILKAADLNGDGLMSTSTAEIEVTVANAGDQSLCNNMSASPTSPLTTHVLNTASGTPAKGLQLQLSRLDVPTQKWVGLTTSSTNSDGRSPGILSPERFTAGTYKLRFETGEFWKQLGQTSFYPYIEIVFTILDPSQKFHIPLLLSPYSYTTYRGS